MNRSPHFDNISAKMAAKTDLDVMGHDTMTGAADSARDGRDVDRSSGHALVI